MDSPSGNLPAERAAALYLRTLPAVRERCERLFRLAEDDRLPHFRLNAPRLDAAAASVAATIRDQYPDLRVPVHSRWRHFPAGGIDRVAELESNWGACDRLERARRKIDLATVSVLLDAGTGPDWSYREPGGNVFRRSEGLAVATLHLFASGLFSHNRAVPWRVDAEALRGLTEARLADGLQAGERNPLTGLAGRTRLLQRLGDALQANAHYFGASAPRPGGLVDYLLAHASGGQVAMTVLWEALIEGLAAIWPEDRATLGGLTLGDVWTHSALTGTQPGASLVPFHKLTQWLAYSLLEPLEEAGLRVTGSDELTGLAEYRNGGLFVDSGVLVARDPALHRAVVGQGSEAVVEWRGLTVALLDRVAERVRRLLGLSVEALPLGSVLQGGTWEAGRRLARELRPDGAPPFRIESDGMLF
jgi:hypothetical protein